MSLVNGNSFLLELVLSWVVLGEATTVPTSADDNKVSLIPKIKVEIFNYLPDGANLNIHCKSGDDDLGNQVVRSGEIYSFQFRVNFWGTTLFFCGASWQGGQVEFDIFRVKRDITLGRCYDLCRWEAHKDAIVGLRNDGTDRPNLFFPWKHQS
ncbi:S-protein homolog 6-like [Punica granatum]|uniref:S-protein homolog n=1 Tax=Punica granatum TaxID=22663 RepID=A0A218WEM5_PUNGR|nr:S-protein homolog 6-like [Punica granatum]OWM70949.1 hypothetical protein CDL15_Pgr013130 [Punica granatum]